MSWFVRNEVAIRCDRGLVSALFGSTRYGSCTVVGYIWLIVSFGRRWRFGADWLCGAWWGSGGLADEVWKRRARFWSVGLGKLRRFDCI